MKKIFIPATKKDYNAKGFWIDPSSGKLYKDFITYRNAEAVTVKELKNLCKEYRQEAIFFEAINNKTGKKNSATCFYASGKIEKYNAVRTFLCYGVDELKNRIRKFKLQGVTCYTIEKIKSGVYRIFTWKKDFAGRIFDACKGKRLVHTGQKTFCKDNLNEADNIQVLYHYSNINLKHNEALTPDNFGNNYFTQNDVNACNVKRLFFYTEAKPEALLAGSRFLYTCRIEASRIYN